MVKKQDNKISRLQHKKFQGVYDPSVDKDVLKLLLIERFTRFAIVLIAIFNEPDETRPGYWHTHCLVVTEKTMTLLKDETLKIDNSEPTLLRIENEEHLSFLKNYSNKSDKNVYFYPPDYPYPKEYKDPLFMRKINDNNTTPDSLVSLSTSIREGAVDILREGGSMARIKSIVKLLSKGEPILVSVPPEDISLRKWQEKFMEHLESKEYSFFEESKPTADPLSRYNIVLSPIPSQGFNFFIEYYTKHVVGTANIKVDTEDAMALNIYNIYLRNGLRPIRNIMLRVDDTTIFPKDFDTALGNFFRKQIVAKTRGGSIVVPTAASIDITIFTHDFVPTKHYAFHSQRLKYVILDRFYDIHSTLTYANIHDDYKGYDGLRKHITQL